MMTVREVSSYLRIHPSVVYKLLRRGELPGFRIGTDWRFNAEVLDRWLRERRGDRGQASSGARVLNPIGSPPSSLGAEAPLPEDDDVLD
ncbi:MAG: helix-turn-helix domain-containing protein [Candidatus Binataceae bacterium]